MKEIYDKLRAVEYDLKKHLQEIKELKDVVKKLMGVGALPLRSEAHERLKFAVMAIVSDFPREIKMPELIKELNMPNTAPYQIKVGRALRSIGWTNAVVWRNNKTIRVWIQQ